MRVVNSKSLQFSLVFALVGIIALQLSARTRFDGDPAKRVIKRVTTRGKFLEFNKEHRDRFYFEEENGFRFQLWMDAPEIPCFLANHRKDALELTYQVVDQWDSVSKSYERRQNATKIISLKNGDVLSEWTEKEAKDSVLANDHHEVLRNYLTEMGLK